VDVMVI